MSGVSDISDQADEVVKKPHRQARRAQDEQDVRLGQHPETRDGVARDGASELVKGFEHCSLYGAYPKSASTWLSVRFAACCR